MKKSICNSIKKQFSTNYFFILTEIFLGEAWGDLTKVTVITPFLDTASGSELKSISPGTGTRYENELALLL